MKYNFTTERIIAKEWHSFKLEELSEPNLVDIIENILVPEVTKTFPVMWQGKYDKRRAEGWIEERDSEAKSILAVDKNTKKAIGFINFYKVGDGSTGTNIRLGYVVDKEMWCNGFATEFVAGFMRWCGDNDISKVLAGVDPNNIASIRVLEKNDFLTETRDSNGIYHLFHYSLA